MGIKIILLLAFFTIMITVGIICRKQAADVRGFVLGGRNVGPWLTAFAYGTSYFSAVIFVGYAVVQYNLNVTFIAQLMGLSWGALAGCFLAPFLYSLYWKGTTKVSCIVCFVWGSLLMITNMFFKASLQRNPQQQNSKMSFPAIARPLSFPLPKH